MVGAGPFGLSAAAWLGDEAQLFGSPMQTWRTVMPPGMLLRSAWEETSLSAPGGAGSIDAWAAEAGELRREPIPLELFLRYADWFRERFVSHHAEADVVSVEPADGGFALEAADGSSGTFAAVVLAVGVTPFPYAPPAFEPFVGSGVGFVAHPHEERRFAGRRVIVVGAGQAGLETAAVAARAGGQVEVLARSRIRWFADREPHTPRGAMGRRLYRLAYPAVGYGPPPLNRLVLYPDVFAALPPRARRRLTRRLLRPGGSPWVRGMLGGVVLTERTGVVAVRRGGECLELELDDGSTRVADEVLLATGYRFALDRLEFLAPELRAGVETEHGWPVLDRRFESSVPGLFFTGYAAEGRFGPLSRFVLGAAFTAPRVRDGAARRVRAAEPAATARGR